MFKIIGRVAIIGLIVGGAWYLWSSPAKEGSIKNEFVEIKETEKPAKKSDNKPAFEIKKRDHKALTKTVAELTNSNGEVVKVELSNPVFVNNSNKLTPNISKFIEGEESTSMTVYFYEYQIDLSSNEIPTGNVVFRAVNNGRLSHNLTIKDGNGQVNFGRVAPGETKYFQANLSKSELTVISLGRTDEAHNMIKSLSVK